jgi:hypothetical protein
MKPHKNNSTSKFQKKKKRKKRKRAFGGLEKREGGALSGMQSIIELQEEKS